MYLDFVVVDEFQINVIEEFLSDEEDNDEEEFDFVDDYEDPQYVANDSDYQEW
jgi:hypothetical protein